MSFQKLVTLCRGLPQPLQACEVYNGLDENGIIPKVGALACQFSQWAEEWAATGYVHLTDWSLERGGAYIRPEGINDMLPVILIQQHQCHLQGRERGKRTEI